MIWGFSDYWPQQLKSSPLSAGWRPLTLTTSPTLGFPGGSLGREGGRGGGGGGVGLLVQAEGVAGRAGDEEPVNQ